MSALSERGWPEGVRRRNRDRRRRFCPVCWRPVLPTHHGKIEGHWDSIGRSPCPMSYEAYRLAELGRRAGVA